MNLPDFAVRRPVTIFMAVMLVLLLGSVSLTRVGIDLLPEMNFPVAAVITQYSGVGPQEIENLITRPLEETLGTVTNVDKISSISADGNSIVVAEFNMGTDMDFATLEIREKVDLIKGWLPEDAGQPMVIKFDPSLMPVMIVGLGGMEDLAQLKDLAEDTVKPRLERLEGIASVNVQGGVQREIEVRLHPAALDGYGVSIDRVLQTLAAENLTLPAGTLREGERELTLRTTGEFQSVAEIREIPLLTERGALIKIGDLGTVEDKFAEGDQIARLNGKPAVGLVVQEQTGAYTAQLGKAIRSELAALTDQYPQLEFTYMMDFSAFIEDTISGMARDAVIGALLAVLILLLFLRNIKTTMVIAIAIPISVVGTFILVHFAGLTLNVMTLGGIALGVGMLVDNAIVVLENIFRFWEEGHSPLEAARQGAAEVGAAVTASTLTTVGVFLPIVYVEGIISEIFRQLSLTITFALLTSLVVSFTLTPLLASRLLRGGNNKDDTPRKKGILQQYSQALAQWLQRLEGDYGRGLSWCLKNRYRLVAGALAMFVISLALIPFLGTEFLPATDEGRIDIRVRLPVGSPLEATEEVAQRVAQIAARMPQVQDVYYSIGTGDGMNIGIGGGSERADIDVTLVPLRQRRVSTEKVAEELRGLLRDIPGARIGVSIESMITSGMTSAPISIAIKGDELEVLTSLADQVMAAVEDIPGLRDPDTSISAGMPELQLQPRRQRLAALGLTTGQVAMSIDTALRGRVATRLRVEGEEIDIRVRLGEDLTKEDIQRLIIPSPLGLQLTLADVVDFVPAEGPRSISREDQARLVTVTAGISGRSLGSVMKDVQRQVDEVSLPEGYFIEYGGEYLEMSKAFSGLELALILAVILVYAILAAQFESLVHPFTIMFSVPFAAIGAILGLFITGRTLCVTSAIGAIMLAGIVVNNAIILVDYINILRRGGLPLEEAIVRAGSTRLRPILMTTLTTILAMIPLSLGFGAGSELLTPLATVVVGGLTSSTFLTLFLVPTVYMIVDGFKLNFTFPFSIKGFFAKANPPTGK